MKVTIAAGKDFRFNDLTVVAAEDVVVELVTATNEDQAAGLCAAHGIPADMSQFVHQEDDVQVSYNHLGERIETRLEPVPVEEVGGQPEPASTDEASEPAEVDEATEPATVPTANVAYDAPTVPSPPPIPTPTELAETNEGAAPALDGEPAEPSTEEAAA